MDQSQIEERAANDPAFQVRLSLHTFLTMLSTPQNRAAEAEVNEEQRPSNSRRLHSINQMKLKLWMIANYEYVGGALTPKREVFKHASDAGVFVADKRLGKIVTHLFGEKICRVKRGYQTGRELCYLNLKRRQHHVTNSNPSGSDTGAIGCLNYDFPLPNRWTMVKDHATHTSFIRHLGWEFNNQRGTVELSVLENENHKLSMQVKCHGRLLDVIADLDFASVLDGFSAKEQVLLVIQFIDESSFCTGIKTSSDEDVVAMIPHVSGVFKDLTKREATEEKRAFCLDCFVFEVYEPSCSECRHLLRIDKRRKRRLNKRVCIHPTTNERFLTKEEVHMKMKQLSKLRKTSLDNTETEAHSSDDESNDEPINKDESNDKPNDESINDEPNDESNDEPINKDESNDKPNDESINDEPNDESNDESNDEPNDEPNGSGGEWFLENRGSRKILIRSRSLR